MAQRPLLLRGGAILRSLTVPNEFVEAQYLHLLCIFQQPRLILRSRSVERRSMFPRKILPNLLLVAALVGLSTGCSSLARYRFKQAQKLEKQGNAEQALARYSALLEQIPSRDKELRSQVYFRIGECFWQLERVNEALAAFEAAADVDEKNLPAHLRMGEIYLAGGAAQRATEQAHTILQLAAANLDGLALLGAASSAVGNTSIAQQAFERVLKSDPQRVNVAVALADIYNREDRVDEAREVLRAAATAQPMSARPSLALGRLEEQEGRANAAEQAYRSAVAAEDSVESNLRLAQFLQRAAKVKEAEQVLSHTDRLRPATPVALSDFKLISGEPMTALERYTTALRSPLLEKKKGKSFWSREPVSADAQAASRASLAARVIEADLLAGAERGGDGLKNAAGAARLHLEEYRQELDPATVSTLEAEIAVSERNLIKAGIHADAAVEQAPTSSATHYVRGVVNFLRGDKAQARADWIAALDQDSTYVPARLALAKAALSTGDFDTAEQYVIAVVREEPGNLQGLILFSRVLMAQRKFESAALIARRAATIDSNAAEPRVLLGQIALAQGNVPSALHELEQAIALQPHSEEALQGLSQIYRRGKITRPMLAELERIAQTPPASAPLMEIAGRIYAEHGWRDDARRCLNRALEIDPGRGTAATLLAGIQARQGDYTAALSAGSKVGGSPSAVLNGVRAEEQRDVAGAMREYDRAIREGDSTGVAANNLAWLMAEQGKDLDRAMSLALNARSLLPSDPGVLDTVGFVHLKRREYSQAIKVLKEASLLASRQNAPAAQLAEIRKHLSEAHYRAGENTEAAAALSKERPALRTRASTRPAVAWSVAKGGK